ncbi:threonine-phosphate decarboxylase CobD [Clostridium sp. D33t1_170424_F3]|uniref:threonine-phosphate decarboxylase CobD n=1 Tax=Clostridium sp. D33t1_170424_F3 TaxID=2787099 RepID=UPI003369F494
MNLIHGGDIYSLQREKGEAPLDFSANINPLGMPPGAVKAAMDSLEECVHYPDPLCRALRDAISVYESVSPEQIVCGNGAADLIFRITAAAKPRTALLPVPTFAEYEQALTAVGCECRFYSLKDTNDFALMEDFLQELTPEVDIVFLCNPNNPTGRTIKKDLLLQIVERCKNCSIRLVVDECFNDFLDEPGNHTMKPHLNAYPNMVLLKAFTKIFAMPGLRCGYALSADLRFIDALYTEGQPWSVSIPAQKAGIAALTDEAYLKDTNRLIRQERVWLARNLEQLGAKVYPPEANYILFRIEDAGAVQKRLADKGILVRGCGNYRGLDDRYLRVAVRGRKENERLIDALENSLKG